MLVAVSGSQGSGKSTVLQEIENRGFNVVKRKTSRSVLAEWDVTLEQVNNDPELTIKFQEELVTRKSNDELPDPNELWFTERTFTDLFVYSLVSLGKNNKYSDWLTSYYRLCKKYNRSYDLVYYLRAGHFSIEHDGVRGSNHLYSKMVDLIMLDFTKQMVHNNRISIIDTPNLQQRVDIITIQSQEGI